MFKQFNNLKNYTCVGIFYFLTFKISPNGSRIKEGLLLPNLKKMRNSKANFLLMRCYWIVCFCAWGEKIFKIHL